MRGLTTAVRIHAVTDICINPQVQDLAEQGRRYSAVLARADAAGRICVIIHMQSHVGDSSLALRAGCAAFVCISVLDRRARLRHSFLMRPVL